MNKLIGQLKFLINKGLFHIFGTNVINSGINFITNIVVVKFLTKESYGIFSYANNAISIFSLLSGLGLVSGILQYCSEKREEEEKNKIYKFGFCIGIGFNFLLSLAIYLYGMFGNIAIDESAQYIRMLMFLPLFELLYNFITIILRVKKENKLYARLLNFNTVAYAGLSCLGAVTFGVTGMIIGRYCAFLISILAGSAVCFKTLRQVKKAKKLEKITRRMLLKYSFTCCISNSISQLLYLLDVYLIGVFILDSSVIAAYKVATLIPTALTFIPSGLMVFIYPYFAENNNNLVWIKEKINQMFIWLSILNFLISCVLFVGAPLIIKILWGEGYMDSVTPFRILSVNFFFLATFRVPCGNILAMLRRVNYNLLVSVISGIANVVLDIWLIKRSGSNGAAVATLCVVIISSVLMVSYLTFILRRTSKSNEKIS